MQIEKLSDVFQNKVQGSKKIEMTNLTNERSYNPVGKGMTESINKDFLGGRVSGLDKSNLDKIFSKNKISGLDPSSLKHSLGNMNVRALDSRIIKSKFKSGSMKFKNMDKVLKKNMFNKQLPKFQSKISNDYFRGRSSVMNNKLPKNITGFSNVINKRLPKNIINFPKTIRSMDNKANKFFAFNPEQVGLRRLKQQKYLSNFGDYDRDGLANILDCNPFDRKKQAEWHEAVEGMRLEEPGHAREMTTGKYISPSLLEGKEEEEKEFMPPVLVGERGVEPLKKGEIVPIDITLPIKDRPRIEVVDIDMRDERPLPIKEAKVIDVEAVEIKPPKEAVEIYDMEEKRGIFVPPGVVEKAKAGVRKIGEVTGITERLEERKKEKEWLKGIREEARKEVLPEVEKVRREKIVERERERIMREAGIPITTPSEELYRKLLARGPPETRAELEYYKMMMGEAKRARPRQLTVYEKVKGGVVDVGEGLAGLRVGLHEISAGVGAAVPEAGEKISKLVGVGGEPGRLAAMVGTGRGVGLQYMAGLGTGRLQPYMAGLGTGEGFFTMAGLKREEEAPTPTTPPILPPIIPPPTPPPSILPPPVSPPVYPQVAPQYVQPGVPMPVSPQVQVQPTFQQAQAQPTVGVRSPYSKRRVSYVRGPYKKRSIMVS